PAARGGNDQNQVDPETARGPECRARQGHVPGRRCSLTAFAWAPITADYFADAFPDSDSSLRVRCRCGQTGPKNDALARTETFAETKGVRSGSDSGRAAELRRGNQCKAPDFAR